MLEKDVILSKIAIIKKCLGRIKQVTKPDPESLSKIDAEDIFVLNLQRAIQATLDIAHAVISQNDYALPNSYKMSFKVLHENGWIDHDTCVRLRRWSGFAISRFTIIKRLIPRFSSLF